MKRNRVDRIAEIDVALFSGYVFCHFDSNKRVPISMTPGVVGVVGRGISQSRWTTPKSRPSERLRCRDVLFSRGLLKIRAAGPASGWSAHGCGGNFLRVKDGDHLVISITLLRRAVSVVIEKDAVAPLFSGEHHAA